MQRGRKTVLPRREERILKKTGIISRTITGKRKRSQNSENQRKDRGWEKRTGKIRKNIKGHREGTENCRKSRPPDRICEWGCSRSGNR